MADEEGGEGAGEDGEVVKGLNQLSDEEDLLGNILARLYPQALVQAQLVCKKWNMVVRGQRAKQGSPWFLLNANLRCGSAPFDSRRPFLPGPEWWEFPCGEFPHCWAYDPGLERWFRVSLPASVDYRHVHFCGATAGSGVVAFVERVGFRHLEFLRATDLAPEVDRGQGKVADLNALAAAAVDPCVYDTVWVGNPLRKTWRRVPCHRAPFTDVVVSRTGSFKVVQHRQTAARRTRVPVQALRQGEKLVDECAWGMRVFDSVTGRWTEAATVRTSAPASTERWDGSRVGDGGLIFYLKAEHVAELGLPMVEVLSYSVERDRWSVPAPAATVSHPEGRPCCKTLRVFVHQGAVEVLAGISMPGNRDHGVRLFGFYRYDAEANGWAWDKESEVRLLDHFFEIEVWDMTGFHAVGGGGHVQLVCFRNNVNAQKRGPPFLEVLKYEASSKRWTKQRSMYYPDYPHRSVCYKFWQDEFVGFHPRLDSGTASES